MKRLLAYSCANLIPRAVSDLRVGTDMIVRCRNPWVALELSLLQSGEMTSAYSRLLAQCAVCSCMHTFSL
jgi:hypothetical protein